MDKNDIIKSIRYEYELCELLKKSEEIVLYGAGNAGKEFFKNMSDSIKRKVIAFVVSDLNICKERNIAGVDILSIDELENRNNNPLILITIRRNERYEVEKELQYRTKKNVHLVNWEALDLYNQYFGNFNKEKRDKLYNAIKNWDLECDTVNKLYNKMLNIGKFISSYNSYNRENKLLNVSFNFGGSGVLDYLLLRILVLKYKIKSYFEIGTYIGDSLTAVSDLVETCYSLSVPEEHPAHMKNWCKARHMIDYSGKLVKGDNIVQFLSDSKLFLWDEFKDKVNLYFVDGDHSFQGVLVDSINIAERMDWENDIIVWHDCRSVFINNDVVEAIKIALGKHYENFYIFDNCMCGIYIPPKYKNDFIEVTPNDKLITYCVKVSVNEEIE